MKKEGLRAGLVAQLSSVSWSRLRLFWILLLRVFLVVMIIVLTIVGGLS